MSFANHIKTDVHSSLGIQTKFTSRDPKCTVYTYHILHPSADKPFNLLNRAYPDATSKSVKKIMKQIAMSCDECHGHTSAPKRFPAVIPLEKILFNQEIAMDFMWNEGVLVIHVVETHTGFQNATELRGESPAEILRSSV